MLNRRELLRRFGVGAVIIPVVGAPLGAAVLVEEPIIKLVEPPKIIVAREIDLTKINSVTVTVRTSDGDTATLEAGMMDVWNEGALSGGVKPQKLLTGEPINMRLKVWKTIETSPSTRFTVARIELKEVTFR